MPRWSLSDLALDRPVTAGMALVAVLLLGLVGIAKMPLSFLPLQQQPRISARILVDDASPEMLEHDVIGPLEAQIAGIRDLQRIQVGSGPWGVRFKLDFEPETDINARKSELRDRIERIRGSFPDAVQGIRIGSYTNFDDPVLEIQVASGTDLSEDYNLIQERVVRAIERIPGVARVQFDGVSPPELEIAVDLEQAAQSAVSLRTLRETIRSARAGRSLGTLRGSDTMPGVRTPTPAADTERFATLPILREPQPSSEGDETPAPATFATLQEVARVGVKPEETKRVNRLNGRNAVNLDVYATAGASPVAVSGAVQQTIEDLGGDPALDGIELLVQEDQGRTILRTLADLRDTGLYGGCLGVIVLFLFLHRVRTTVAAAVCIPLAVLTSCAVLFLRGDTLNCIVMLGLVIAIGMLIDNAVVIVEAICHRAQQGAGALEAARLGARDVSLATVASTASTVIVFLPLVLIESGDPMTAFLRPLGITFAITLIASLLISQTAVPLLAGRLLPPRAKTVQHPLLDTVADGYTRIIGRTLRSPRLAITVGLVLAASAIWPARNINVRLTTTEIQPDSLPIRIRSIGTHTIEQMGAAVEALETAVLTQKDTIGARTISCSYFEGFAFCKLYPSDPFESEQEAENFKTRVEAVLPTLPTINFRLGQRQFEWRESNDRNLVEFVIRGDEIDTLLRLDDEVAEHLRKTLPKGAAAHPNDGGYESVNVLLDAGVDVLTITLDGDRLQRVGLTADAVSTQVELAFQGLPLGTVRSHLGELTIRLRARIEGVGSGLASVRDLKIRTPTGSSIPLGTLGTLGFEGRPWFIQRVDRETEAPLSVRMFGTDVDDNWAVVGDALDSFSFPPGYAWGRGTKWRRQKEANVDWIVNLGLCLLLVYAVMASLFESFLQPLGILVTCLLGCFGAVWALWLTDTTLDTTAVVGFFILIGIVVNNGIMVVDKITQLRRRGIAREAALIQAGRERLRPILMTVTTTVLGLVPMLIHHPTLAGIYYHSIAIIITGGLLTSTFTTLLFLPATHSLIEGASASASQGFSRVKRWRS